MLNCKSIRLVVLWIAVLGYCSISEALVVPQELPSILSLVYSNIPPIKKGTDSRLGFGFRLGEHADFQVMLELGPQKETRPIGDQEGESSFNKRQVNKQQQKAFLLRQQQKQRDASLSTSTERNAANWLENWSYDMTNNKKKLKQKHKINANAKKHLVNGQETPEVPVVVVPPETLKQLQQLYKMAAPAEQKQSTDGTAQTNQKKTTEIATVLDRLQGVIKQKKSKEEITKELMDVSLEEGE